VRRDLELHIVRQNVIPYNAFIHCTNTDAIPPNLSHLPGAMIPHLPCFCIILGMCTRYNTPIGQDVNGITILLVEECGWDTTCSITCWKINEQLPEATGLDVSVTQTTFLHETTANFANMFSTLVNHRLTIVSTQHQGVESVLYHILTRT